MIFYIDNLRLSPYTYSVLNALLEKGLSFKITEVQFQKNQSVTEGFSDQVFTDLIPALDDRGLVLWESLAILEYLEEKYPAPQYVSILPSQLGERAKARMLLSWYRGGMTALRQERPTDSIFYPENRANLKPLSLAAREEVQDLTAFLKTILKPGAGFLFEERWTIADSETALMLQRLIKNQESIDPELEQFALKTWDRSAVRAFVDFKRPPFRSYYS